VDGLGDILQQVREFAAQHVPADALPPTVPLATLVMLTGVVVAVFGARLARLALTTAFGLGGAYAAARFAHAMDLPPALSVIVGAALIAGIGYCLYRLWVGIGVAALLCMLALSVFGYYRVLPEAIRFNESHPASVALPGESGFTLLDAGEQAEYSHPSPQKWAHDFWTHLTTQQADIRRNGAAVALAAALVGLLVGLLATRPALVACTALVGTAVVGSGLLAFSGALAPRYYRAALDRPVVLAGAAAGLFLVSVVLQARLGRRLAPSPVAKPAK